MIRAENLTKRYDRSLALDGVSFTVADGESVALWGPNGAGKTTIVRCILGLVNFEGDISVNGVDCRSDPKATRKMLGHVSQDLSFFDDATAWETLELVAAIRRVDHPRVEEVLEQVELIDHRAKRVRELSGGMRQRLAIAAALIDDPPVLLLDEPTASLDVSSREKMARLLEDLRTPDRSMILTSHDLDEVGMLVDRVIAMADGRIQQECHPSELAERLGIRSWLHVIIDAEQTPKATAVLGENGFNVRPNSSGVLVEVSAQRKAAALSTLEAGGISVRDFEVWR